MEELVTTEDWEALQGLLAHGVKVIESKKVESVKLAILEFYSTASMLGLEDIADVAKKFEDFLLTKVAPGWGGEATATLSFSMGGLLEKMQLNKYSPDFSAGLSEILMFMEFYEEDEPPPAAAPKEEPPPPPPAPPEVRAAAPAPAPEPVAAPPEPEIDLSDLDLSIPEDLASEPAASLPADDVISEDLVEPDLVPSPVVSKVPEVDKTVAKAEKPAPAAIPAKVAPDKVKPSGQTPARRLEKAAQSEYKYTVPSLPKAIPAEKPAGDEVGYVTDALDWYREMLREDPASRVFVPLAEELCNREMWREAADTCRRGLVRHPFDLRAMVLLGLSLLRLGDSEQAQTVLGEARYELEKNAVLYGALAEIAEASGDEASAQHLMSVFTALQSGEQRFPAWMVRGFLAYEPDFEARAFTAPAGLSETVGADSGFQVERGADDSSLVQLLSALMRTFEEKPSEAPACGAMFTASDREALRAILHGRGN